MTLPQHEYIHNILYEIDFILSNTSDLDYDTFIRNGTIKRAFIRSLEIIGANSKKLPDDVKAMQPDIEWKKISEMSERLIHDYFKVDYAEVWDVMTTKLADHRSKFQSLLIATKQLQKETN